MMRLSHFAGALLAFSAFTQTAVAAGDDTVYQGLGGKAGIEKIVASFIPLIQADERIKESFKDSDMKNLKLRLEQQFCLLSGGPCEYKGKDMATIHDGLNVTNAQFNAITEDLFVAMEQNAVPSRVQMKLVATLAPLQRAIVTK
ncbi:MAG: group 1 truncated hemoglobin [Massilia sp.]